MPVNQYRLISFDRQMGIGVAGSMQATISAVAKANSPSAPYCVPNELICAELGRFLRLPVPPCGIIHAPDAPVTTWFASLDFNLAGSSLPPVDAGRCVTELPQLSAGLLAFDILVANCDRHRKNFAVDFSLSPPRMAVFDHSHALMGYEPGKGADRLRDLQDRLAISGGSHTRGNRHCLLDLISTDDHFGLWLERIRAIPDFLIEDLCRDAADLGASREEAQFAADFLRARRDNIAGLIKSHQNEFRAIRQWRLIP
jgi:hypothetical protein